MCLPNTFTSKIYVTIHNRDAEVVASNLALLLYILDTLGDEDIESSTIDPACANTLKHLWYSALLPADVESTPKEMIL